MSASMNDLSETQCIGSTSRRRRRRRSIQDDDDESQSDMDDTISHAPGHTFSLKKSKAQSKSNTIIHSNKRNMTQSRARTQSSSEEDEDDANEVVTEGYDFILSAIGGEPSERAVKQMLKSIDAPKEHWEVKPGQIDLEQEEGAEGHVNQNENNNDQVVRNLGFDDNSFINDDDINNNMNSMNDNSNVFTTTAGGHRPSQRDVLTNDDMFRRDNNSIILTRRGSENQQKKKHLNILQKPRTIIYLNNVIRKELVFINQAHLLNFEEGSKEDDNECQSTISIHDWLFSAEHLVGLSTSMSNSSVQTRKIWSALFESRTFEMLSSVASISESHITIITGLCLRLLLSTSGQNENENENDGQQFQLDMGIRLVKELLKVRDSQLKLNNGMDSLQIVLSTGCTNNNIDKVPFRHKAIVAIWVALLHAAKGKGTTLNESMDQDLYVDDFEQGTNQLTQSNEKDPNNINESVGKLLKDALKERMNEIFESANSTPERSVRGSQGRSAGFSQLEAKVSSFIDTLRFISFTSAIKLDILQDFHDPHGSMSEDELEISKELPNNVANLIPHNWMIVCDLLARFETEIQSFGKTHRVKSFLTYLLENIAFKLCSNTWKVDTATLSGCAKALVAVARKSSGTDGTVTCFCEQNPTFITRYDEFPSEENANENLSDLLKTPCDLLMYIGRTYVLDGNSANGMKRVMNVIRYNSPLTNLNNQSRNHNRNTTAMGTMNSKTNSSPAVRAVRHHVGVVLSIADTMSESVGGEEHVLKMLISKSTDLKTVLKSVHTGRADPSSPNAYLLESAINGEENEKWDVLYKVIVARCETVLKKSERVRSQDGIDRRKRNSGSVDVYVKWLGNGVVEGFNLMKRVVERRASARGDKESLRIQEGILNAVLTKRIIALKEVLKLVWNQIDRGDFEKDHLLICGSTILEPCIKLFTFCKEYTAQLRMLSERVRNEAEHGSTGVLTTGKSKDKMLVDVLQVLELALRLLAHLSRMMRFTSFTSSTSRNSGINFSNEEFDTLLGTNDGKNYSNINTSNVQKLKEFLRCSGPFAALMNLEHDAAITDLLTFDGIILSEIELKPSVKCHAALISSLMTDLRLNIGDVGWGGTNNNNNIEKNCEGLVALVKNCKLDVINVGKEALLGSSRFANGIGKGGREVSEKMDKDSMIRFWWWGIKSCWVKHVFENYRDVRTIILGMIAWMIVTEHELRNDRSSKTCGLILRESDNIMFQEIKESLKIWECMEPYVENWPSNSDSNNDNDDSGIYKCLKLIITKVAEDCGRPWTRALIGQIRQQVVQLVKDKRESTANDGLQSLSMLLELEADARGFCTGNGSRWMSNWLAEIYEGIQRRASNSANTSGNIGQHVQRSVMCALSLVSSDGREGELRMFILRLINSMHISDDLSGIWSIRNGMNRLKFNANYTMITDEMKKRTRRNVQTWKTYIFRSVVEESVMRGASTGKPVSLAVKRLGAAVDRAMEIHENESRDDLLLSLVKAFVQKVRSNGLETNLLGEGGARVTWKRLCCRLGLDVDLID